MLHSFSGSSSILKQPVVEGLRHCLHHVQFADCGVSGGVPGSVLADCDYDHTWMLQSHAMSVRTLPHQIHRHLLYFDGRDCGKISPGFHS